MRPFCTDGNLCIFFCEATPPCTLPTRTKSEYTHIQRQRKVRVRGCRTFICALLRASHFHMRFRSGWCFSSFNAHQANDGARSRRQQREKERANLLKKALSDRKPRNQSPLAIIWCLASTGSLPHFKGNGAAENSIKWCAACGCDIKNLAKPPWTYVFFIRPSTLTVIKFLPFHFAPSALRAPPLRFLRRVFCVY